MGWSIAEIAEQNLEILAECFPDPQYRQKCRDFLSAANGRWDDFKVKVRDGRILDVTAAVVRLSDGTRLAIGQDISERKQAEEQLTITSDQLRKLSASLQSAREEEGMRIARELHDELGATLSSLRWDLEYALEVVSESNDLAPLTDLRKRIEDMIKLADTTLSSVRRIVAELRPIGLDELGLSEAVEWQARQFQERTGIVVECDCALEHIDLSHQQLIAVFRIFQEGLTNILRHAQATKVSIQIVEEKGELILTIKDNGRGITDEEKSGKRTLGLLGMRERAHLIGGKVDISGVERVGTLLTVKIPLPAKLARAIG
jgi:signal transduction histidine kinase